MKRQQPHQKQEHLKKPYLSQNKPLQDRSFFKEKISSTSISSLLDKYTYYLQYEKNASPKTIENYTLRLNRFLEFCGDIEISKVNRMQLLDYRMALHKQ